LQDVLSIRIEPVKTALPFVLAPALTACSGDKPASAASINAAPQADACSFLTAQAVSAAVGKTFGEGRKTNEVGGGKSTSHMTTCTWEIQASTAGASPAEIMRNSTSVILILWSYPNAERGQHYLDSFRKVAKEMSQPEPTAVSIGDEAILDSSSVHVRQGNSAFTLTVQALGNTDQAAARKAAEALAGQVSAKL
jgi:hypothetical protein